MTPFLPAKGVNPTMKPLFDHIFAIILGFRQFCFAHRVRYSLSNPAETIQQTIQFHTHLCYSDRLCDGNIEMRILATHYPCLEKICLCSDQLGCAAGCQSPAKQHTDRRNLRNLFFMALGPTQFQGAMHAREGLPMMLSAC
jgi:hypothetical protein